MNTATVYPSRKVNFVHLTPNWSTKGEEVGGAFGGRGTGSGIPLGENCAISRPSALLDSKGSNWIVHRDRLDSEWRNFERDVLAVPLLLLLFWEMIIPLGFLAKSCLLKMCLFSLIL